MQREMAGESCMNDVTLDTVPVVIREERLEKFFAARAAQRAMPGNCGRCGKPNLDPSRKTCPTCRLYRVKYHLRKTWKPISLNEAQRQLTELEARLYKLEQIMKHSQTFAQSAYQRGLERGRSFATQEVK
jgi:hypothetical protein